jgi:hypothetical protein
MTVARVGASIGVAREQTEIVASSSTLIMKLS